MKKILTISSIIFLVLFIDQFSKIYVKTHFFLGESIPILGQNWFRITFVENPGMAYGIELGGLIGKYLLILIRLSLVGAMIYLFRKWIKENTSNYIFVPMSLIFAGAVGNLIDGLFYGMIFDTGSTFVHNTGNWVGYDGVSSFTINDTYSGFMKGCVVDMLHFPLVNFTIPEGIPIIGGQHIEFFKYIFNIADASITIGGIFFIIFRKHILEKHFKF